MQRRKLLLLDDHTERFAGFSAMALPLSSGHVLAVHRFTTSSIGPPFTSVWQRDPCGRWTFYVDAAPSRSCPRYYSPALHDVRVDTIDLVWKSRYDLVLYVRRARLHVALRIAASPATRLLSAIAHVLPDALWRNDSALALAARTAGVVLNAGPLQLAGETPGGHWFRIQPRAVWRVEAAAVTLDRCDLGDIAVLRERVALGDVVMPRAALFVVGATSYQRLFNGSLTAGGGEGGTMWG